MAGPYYTDNGSIENTGELKSRIVRGLHNVGGLAYTEATYTALGTEAAGEFIRICRNKPELNLIPHLSAVDTDGAGATSCTFDIGDANDADKYADGLNVNAAGTILFSANSCAQKLAPVITSDADDDGQGDWIYAEVKTLSGSVTAGRKFKFRLVFSANS